MPKDNPTTTWPAKITPAIEAFDHERAALQSQTAARKNSRTRVVVGMGTCGIAAGARDVLSAAVDEAKQLGLDVDFVEVGCIGRCQSEPLLDVERPGQPRVTYGFVTPDAARRIIREHVAGGAVAADLVLGIIADEARPYDDQPAFRPQLRRVLRNCGIIDPERLDEYIARGGYSGLVNALIRHTPQGVIDEVKASGLRGRGGAGFPTGMKWQFAHDAAGDKKYIICNADEGDPGAFMDRSVLEGDPHAVIEGMLIGAYAIGADEGYIYVRAEYPLAIRRLKLAIEQARQRGLIGESVLGTPFSFDLHIKEGAGAFVCGEETALMASIEGKRGMPRPRPPFPANSGLWGKPTNINNVETWANVPPILETSGAEYAKVGTDKSKGTKVFSLTGKIVSTGLAEVPMGLTLRELIMNIGGGIQNGKAFKAVQIGGPSGGCIPAEMADVAVDYDSLKAAGAMMGSGGLVVLDEDTCMVELARFFLTFSQSESCGKCVPCRVGTKRMLEILERIVAGEGEEGDIERLEELAKEVQTLSLCGLGQTAPNPVLTTIKYFRHEYEAHIREKRCPAGVCKALKTYRIDADKCKGCTVCLKSCPASAISGEKLKPHTIDASKCIKCDTCRQKCKFDAITLA